jgi:hypothetical protein
LQQKINKLESSSSLSRDAATNNTTTNNNNNSNKLAAEHQKLFQNNTNLIHKSPPSNTSAPGTTIPNRTVTAAADESNLANLYTAYPINPMTTSPKFHSNSTDVLAPAPLPPPVNFLNEDTDYFNDGYKTEKSSNQHQQQLLHSFVVNNQQASNGLSSEQLAGGQGSGQLSNIDLLNQKSLNTEKRVMELEKQLERMRYMLSEVTSNETSTLINDETTVTATVSSSVGKQQLQSNQQELFQQQQQQQDHIFVLEPSEVELVNENTRSFVDIDNQMIYLRDSDGFHLPIYTENVSFSLYD